MTAAVHHIDGMGQLLAMGRPGNATAGIIFNKEVAPFSQPASDAYLGAVLDANRDNGHAGCLGCLGGCQRRRVRVLSGPATLNTAHTGTPEAVRQLAGQYCAVAFSIDCGVAGGVSNIQVATGQAPRANAHHPHMLPTGRHGMRQSQLTVWGGRRSPG